MFTQLLKSVQRRQFQRSVAGSVQHTQAHSLPQLLMSAIDPPFWHLLLFLAIAVATVHFVLQAPHWHTATVTHFGASN